jgi:MFS family permease
MAFFNKSASGHDPYLALRFPEFRYFISVRFLVTLALQIEGVVVGWQLYEITKDPLSLGLIGLAEALPAIAVALFAGYLADKVPRKRIVMSTYVLLFITAIILLVFAQRQEILVESFGVWPVYLAIFISGIARGFLAPANFAFMSQLVPRNVYLNSSTWNSTMWQIGSIAGPAVGGLLYALYQAEFCYWVVSVLLLIAFILFAFIKNRPLPDTIKEEAMGERLLSGVKFVFKNQVILGAISLDLFAVLFGGAVALLPIFASDILFVGPSGLGVLRAAPAMGSAVMALVLAFRAPMQNAGVNMLIAVAGFGVSMIAFGLSTNFYLSVAFLFLSGAFDNVSVVIRATLLQLLTPDHMRGRVSSVNSMFIGSSNEIGAFESGVTARLMGVVSSVVFGGCMTLGVVAVTWLKAPGLRKANLGSLQNEVV